VIFVVVLEVRRHGSPCGTTEDDIEATSVDEAERGAIAAWTAARPDRTFAPLLTVAHPATG
jgi:hypothetical protein